MVYRRRELWVVLFLAASLGLGLAVQEFRAGFPELAERLEQLDAEDKPPAGTEIRPPRFPLQERAKLSQAAAQADNRIDLNQATAAELQRLPGIGPGLAQRILEVRERQGRFASPEDLRGVMGIGAKKFDAIRDLVMVKN